jgi:superfamily I DNA/RNA helicase
MYSDIAGERTVGFMEAASERAEAVAIGKVIEEMVGGFDFHVFNRGSSGGTGPSTEKSFGDFAVLYRTHQQGAVIEEVFANAGIPCQLARPIRRSEGRGVASLLAFLRIISGRCVYSDLEAVRDLIAPGIPPATFAIFKNWGYRCGFSLKKALFQASRLPIAEMSGRRQKRLCEAIAQLSQLEEKTEALSLSERITFLVNNSNLRKFSERGENVTFKQQVVRIIDIADGCGDDISRFFEAVAFQTDTDAFERKAERVALMTIHASKGLEFPVVFIAGCENGLIPYLRDGEATDLEEERRLFYVAMTRAQRHLYFTFARKRGLRGSSQQREVSPFVADIETNLIHRRAKGYQKRQPKSQVQLSLFG